jgi:hypothetical protein
MQASPIASKPETPTPPTQDPIESAEQLESAELLDQVLDNRDFKVQANDLDSSSSINEFHTVESNRNTFNDS